MLVKVDKFIFLVDFIVLVLEEDEEAHVILRRPFIATSGSLIGVLSL